VKDQRLKGEKIEGEKLRRWEGGKKQTVRRWDKDRRREGGKYLKWIIA
jgi:hypothetical protein